MKINEWNISYLRPKVPKEFTDAGYSALLSLILCQRGIDSLEKVNHFVYGGNELLYDPFLLKDMDLAVQRIDQALSRHEIIAVYGDYDVDGITSTCLVSDYLLSRGADCRQYIPVREDEGYGLKRSAIDVLHEQGVQLIITVDCGITAVEETEYARSLGIDVIITDHHECGNNGIPSCVAVIDCKRPDDVYPNKCLAGVGVALKLVCACDGDSRAIVERYCDLVAIGTVADVMTLLDENRYLVRLGLERINDFRIPTRPGISALLRNDKGVEQKLTASNISFSLAPRLNAAGRIDNALTAVQLLLTERLSDATEIVRGLDALNEERKNLGDQIWEDAVDRLTFFEQDAPIVLNSDTWHQGVIGIVASRLSEKYKVPTILICFDGENGKGSCRSYGNFNLFQALSRCASYLVGFGGHALAAGLNIKREQLDAFRHALTQYYRENRPEAVCSTVCDIAIYDPHILDRAGVSSLELLEPYGSGNLKPVMYISDATISSMTRMGANRKHLKLILEFKGIEFEAVAFSFESKFDMTGINYGSRVDVAFTPQINSYNGRDNVQLLISDLKPHTGIELSRALLSGSRDALYFYTGREPDRNYFVQLWGFLKTLPQLPKTLSDLYDLVPSVTSFDQFCLALRVFAETGLLIPDGENILGARLNPNPGKVSFDDSQTLQELRRIRR